MSVQGLAREMIFPIVKKKAAATIVYSNTESKLDSIAAHLLAADIRRVTGVQPLVTTDLANVKGDMILIGSLQSSLIRRWITPESDFFKQLAGRWECYGYKVASNENERKMLIIAGSDARGTAFGVFSLSEKIGVSPWYWWADAPVKQQKELLVAIGDTISSPPSVKYRGIFINDEDWGLQPWAAKTFEPETGDIGPKTYAKVFELLLRLKANLIWPAMHPSTKAFFHYPENVKVAEAYHIVVGSSHAEPMLRNNVDEWDVKTRGHFNYVTNKDSVVDYWEERVKETGNLDVVYTLGIRGVHDGKMEGVKNAAEAVSVLEDVIDEERRLLSKYISKPIEKIPQVFTPYKEVLEIYDDGLKIPEDVTLVWPDDNYGYIRRLSTPVEASRKGGAGVYYHASYWGRPHDYLWLPSLHPSLMREELLKAYGTGADQVWVLNVGDIKPQEYNLQQFADMAYDIKPFADARYTQQHLGQWLNDIFGGASGQKMQPLLWQYYHLAFERKPEFMGWNQTEPNTPISYTGYNHFKYGDEAQRRIDSYTELEREVKELRVHLDKFSEAAFYQLVYYPVVAASLMNKKFLYRDKAVLYSKQGRYVAGHYRDMVKSSYDNIVKETTYFNDSLSSGKWKYIMSMKPRGLDVYQMPTVVNKGALQKGWVVMAEGDTVGEGGAQSLSFVYGVERSRFVDIYLKDSTVANWQARSSDGWIKVTKDKGSLYPQSWSSMERIWISIDWGALSASDKLSGSIDFFDGAGNTSKVKIIVSSPIRGMPDKVFVEEGGIVSMFAEDYHDWSAAPAGSWERIDGLGHTGACMGASLKYSVGIDSSKQQAPMLQYNFYTISKGVATLHLYTLPTHPLNNNHGMRYAVAIDNAPLQIVDFKTKDRNNEWKQNVLSNEAVKKLSVGTLPPGMHSLKIYAIDPGVILDRIVLTVGGDVLDAYSVIPETLRTR